MFRQILSLCLCVFLMTGLPALADASKRPFPELSGYTLDGNRRSLPDDLAETSTLVVITLEAPSTEETRAWRSLAAGIDADLPVLFLVLMDERGARARAFAAGRLRGEVTDASDRARTIAVFSDIARFYKASGITGHSGVTGLLVSNEGMILGAAIGVPTEAAQTELSAALSGDQTQPLLALNSAGKAETDTLQTASPAPETQAADPPAAPGLPAPVSPAKIEERADTVADPVVPDMNGYTLAGDRISIPADLASAGTHLYLLRRGISASEIGKHVTAIAERHHDDDDWLLLVFMGKSPTPSKAIAAGRLRGEITDKKHRRHIVPVFDDLASLDAETGFAVLTSGEPICVTTRGSRCETSGDWPLQPAGN